MSDAPSIGGTNFLLLMGVTGSGKTTVGEMLAECLGWRYLEGDDLHPQANIAKMRAGTPLDDTDRWPWLDAIAARMETWRAQEAQGVIACSALKSAYRARLIGAHTDVALVHLHGPQDLIAARLAARTGHFMPPGLLASQFATLEPPTPAEAPITLDIGPNTAALVNQIMQALAERPGS